MIFFKVNNGKFNFRVAGLIFHDNRILIHRLKRDDFFALPGGRVEFMENTEQTLIREMKEELNINVNIDKLLWVGEQFFEIYGEQYHEICYYYLLSADISEFKSNADKFEIVEDERVYEFKWVKTNELKNEVFYPIFIKERIYNLPETIEKFVEVNDVTCMEYFRK
ncbi:MAG: NUDIX hydrolase [Defluviitaleaceae bacterium]|nr:NUDIX hydrolase [Defluviitaleaceae bacterium]